ncbi:MAG TPA: hypothetical protein VGD78_20340 [Chthoniobacterales bacterium]
MPHLVYIEVAVYKPYLRKGAPEALKDELAALELSLHWVLEPKARSKVLCRMHAVTQALQKRVSTP